MKKLTIFIIISSVILRTYSQENFKVGPTYYSKKYSGLYYTNDYDTIYCHLKLKVNPFYKDRINPLSCMYVVKIIEGSGTEKELNAYQIKGFSIDSTFLGKMTFESLTVEEHGTFFGHRIKTGDITLYKYYYPHGYDSSPQFYYLLKKNDEYKFLSPIGFKKPLSLLINDKSDVYQDFIKGNYKFKDIPEVIDLYNNSN